MTKEAMMNKLYKLCVSGVKHEDYSKIRKAFALCNEWNDAQENTRDEIWMREDDEFVMVEDDVVYFNGARF